MTEKQDQGVARVDTKAESASSRTATTTDVASATVTPDQVSNGFAVVDIPSRARWPGRHSELWLALQAAYASGRAVIVPIMTRDVSNAMSQRCWREGLTFRQRKLRDGTSAAWLEKKVKAHGE